MKRTTGSLDPLAPWMEAPQMLWERWRTAMTDGARPAIPDISMWSLPLEFWKATIYGSLEVELAATEAWKAWVCANDANIPEITLGACQTLHFVEDWMRTQMQLWDGWFSALENPASAMAKEPVEAAQQVLKPRTHQHRRTAAAPTG